MIQAMHNKWRTPNPVSHDCQRWRHQITRWGTLSWLWWNGINPLQWLWPESHISVWWLCDIKTHAHWMNVLQDLVDKHSTSIIIILEVQKLSSRCQVRSYALHNASTTPHQASISDSLPWLSVRVLHQHWAQTRHDQQNLPSPWNVFKISGSLQSVKSNMCQKQDGQQFHRRACIGRKCDNCGTGNIPTYLQDLVDKHSTRLVVWKKWARTSTVHDGKTTNKQCLTMVTGTLAECIEEIVKESSDISSHLSSMLSGRTNVFPISLNNHPLKQSSWYWTLPRISQDEIQSAHWWHTMVTIHPIVCYYACPSCDEIMTEW